LVQSRQQDFAGRLQAGMGQLFLLEFNDDAIQSGRLVNCSGPAEAYVGAAQGLQLNREVLEDVGRIGAAIEPLEKAANLAHAAAMLDQRGEPALKALIEAGYLAGA